MSLKDRVRYGAAQRTSSRLAALLLLAGSGLAAAQTSGGESAGQGQPDTSLPTVTQATTRAELLDLLDRVQTQLGELSADAPSGAGTDAQLAELRSQLEVLLLQAQLERLQRENAALQEQLSNSAQTQGAGSGDSAALTRQLAQLRARQDNMNAQMEVIAHQHAEILEYADLDETQTREAQTREAQIHEVQVGDSLSKLAQEYYDDATRWPDILAANPEVDNPNFLLPGTTLTIPAGAPQASN